MASKGPFISVMSGEVKCWRKEVSRRRGEANSGMTGAAPS